MKNSASKKTETEAWYTLYDVATNICTHCEFFTHGLQPSNSTLKLVTNQIKPIYNSIDDTISDGATPEEILEFNKNKVPKTISQMKLRMQLILSGISVASIYTIINQIPDLTQRELILTKWEYAVTMERKDPMLNQMAELLNITQLQLDEIFVNGNKL